MQPTWGRVRLTEVNPHLVCVLCHGYFVDATTMAECPHSFCRSCIVLYLETKSYCPICEVQIHKTKPHLNLKPDKTLQDIVYKLVPGLFHDEMRRRREFYNKYPNRDLYLSPEARGAGVERIVYSPEDNISLSLEYYDEPKEVDADVQILPNCETFTNRSDREREEWAGTRPGSVELVTQQQPPEATTDGLKRYLQCPAVVTMSHLKKFIRLKYGLSQACTVEILYRRESLPDSYSLMDIAYIYTWKRNGPMRFYYRIHVPTLLKTTLPPLKASSEPIVDPEPSSPTKLRSPELLDAVGLRPKPPEEVAAVQKEIELANLGSKEIEEKKELKKIVDMKELNKVEENMESKKPDEKPIEENVKQVEERPKITPAEDTAVSLLLALSNGHGPKPEQSAPESGVQSRSVERQSPTAASLRPPTANGSVFKVPQSLTKRFVFNGGKLVAVKSKQPAGKPGKTKLNGKLTNGESSLMEDRLSDPLGLAGNGPSGVQGGRLPPGSPRPPPNSGKMTKNKYMPPSGFLFNRLTPDVSLTQNKNSPEPPKNSSQVPSSQPKQIVTQVKTKVSSKPNTATFNRQPTHRKEVNRLEQIVQNCLKKETSQRSASETNPKETEARSDATGVKRSGTLNAGSSEEDARASRADSSIRAADHVAVDPPKTDRVDIAEHKESSILKRKLNDTSNNRRVGSLDHEAQNGLADAKKRRLVTPDVSIELMAKPGKDKQKEKKREPSDLSTLTKRFLHDIQRMKQIDTELKINKVDQMCASSVRIEKVPAPTSQTVSTPKSSPGVADKTKAIDGSDFSSEEDQLFIDIRNKCEAFKRKTLDAISVAIERVTESGEKPTSSQGSPSKTSEAPTSSSDTPSKPCGTHKKLPRLIEINAPPRPKLPALIPDKQKTGFKMTTVRKEVPINKEAPIVRRDCNGALDLSSGVSPPNGTSKSGNKSPFHRPASVEKGPTPSSLSPLTATTSFPSPDTTRGSPIRIPSLKPKTPIAPRPSSLSSSSPSPPAEPRSTADVFPTSAYQQLYRHQMELQSRFLASQVNNNWSRDPLTAKKFEEWMRNMMTLPHHPLMFPSQVSPEAGRK